MTYTTAGFGDLCAGGACRFKRRVRALVAPGMITRPAAFTSPAMLRDGAARGRRG